MDKILSKATQLTREGKPWHFHMLAKGCRFNTEEKYVILFEDEETGETLSAVFEEKPLKEAKALADLLYGKGFLERGKKSGNKDFDLILRKAEELTAQGKEWHHHHFPPRCVFNEHAGKHCIVLEDDDNLLTAVYDEKPVGDLARIEGLFYAEL